VTGVLVADELFRWQWVSDHRGDIQDRLVEHLKLTFVAVGLGLVIAIVLSLLVLRLRYLEAPVTWITGTLYTIPSLALFGFLVPITGLSFTSAEIGLVSYTLLILVRNILAGFDGVPASVREAATGMGYRPWHGLARIELPLALPVIISGLRIATVTTVGLTTVTALIGYGGLGFFIYHGSQRFTTVNGSTEIIVGVVACVLLAVALDLMLVLVEWVVTPWNRGRGGGRRMIRGAGPLADSITTGART
jgi:osmoprotectant transport system permease protein